MKKGTTPMHNVGSAHVATEFVHHGFSVCTRDADGILPLHKAANGAIAAVVLGGGWDPNGMGGMGLTPIGATSK